MPSTKKAAAPARATRSSVRAGTASLDSSATSSPPRLTRRKRSGSSAPSVVSSTEGDSKTLLADIRSGKTNLRALTKAKLEGVIATLLERDAEQIRRIDAMAEENKALHSRLQDRPTHGSSLRRHISIELPAKALAEAHTKTQERAHTTKTHDMAPYTTKTPERAHTTKTPERAAHTSPTPDTPVIESSVRSEILSPASWNIAQLFTSPLKRFFSPSPSSRQMHHMRSGKLQSRVPSPIKEESPSSTRNTPARQQHTESPTQQSRQDSDLAHIVRKRKTPPAQDAPMTKKAKTTASTPIHITSTPTHTHATSTYFVPSDSESDEDEDALTITAQCFPLTTPRTPAQGPRTPAPVPVTPTPASIEPPASRRSAKAVREKRDAAASARGNAATPTTAAKHSARATPRVRPHYFELQNIDKYDTQEALDAAIDAMLEIEAAEDQGLPPPRTAVSPAVRVLQRLRPEHLAPSPSVQRPAQRQAQSANSSKPREPNADKRNAQLEQASLDKEAERARLTAKARQLRLEQQKAEEELRTLEEAEEAQHEVGKKRKSVRVDQLQVIPSRRPGQSSGTFALLDEFFDLDEESVEMDEDQIELVSARPTKMARTETNIFDSATKPSDDALFEQQTAESPNPAAPINAEALQRKRSEAEKYKPTRGSRLREVQRISTGSSAAGSPKAPQTPMASAPAIIEEEESAEVPAVIEEEESPEAPAFGFMTPTKIPSLPPPAESAGFCFPAAEKIFDDELLASLPPLTEEDRERAYQEFLVGLAAFEANELSMIVEEDEEL